MRRLAMVSVMMLAAVVASEPPVETEICELRLKNGSIVRGSLKSPREIKLTREDDVRTLRVEDLLQVTPGGAPPEPNFRRKVPRVDRVVGKSGVLDGKLEAAGPWVIDTGFGSMTVPQEDLRTVGFLGNGAALLYDFGETLPRGFDSIGRSRWKANGTALSVDPAASGDALLLPILLEGDYVLEADVRCDSWAALLFNVEDPKRAAALWLTPGTAGIYALPDWRNTSVRTWTVPTREGQTLHVRLAVSGKHVTVSLDGEVLGEVDVPVEGRKFGFGAWSKPVKFDNVRLSH